MEDKQYQKVEKIFQMISEEYVKPEEVMEIFVALNASIKKTREEIEENIASNKGEMVDSQNNLYSKIKTLEVNTKEIYDRIASRMALDSKTTREQILNIVKDLTELRNSIPKETDLSGIWDKLNELEVKIPTVPEEITPYQIIEKLESIDNESEKLGIEAIKDLRKELDELKSKIGGRVPIGGFNIKSVNFHITDDETPEGTKNGVNTVFTIKTAPSPASSLKVYVNGQRQRVTENYTFSGRTITFVEAPLSTDVILVDYRT